MFYSTDHRKIYQVRLVIIKTAMRVAYPKGVVSNISYNIKIVLCHSGLFVNVVSDEEKSFVTLDIHQLLAENL